MRRWSVEGLAEPATLRRSGLVFGVLLLFLNLGEGIYLVLRTRSYSTPSLGSAVSANRSFIGASANLVTAGIAERAGYRITYDEFCKIDMPVTIISVALGTLWLLIRV